MTRTITKEQFLEWCPRQIEVASEWARANGLDPDEIATSKDPVLEVTWRDIRYWRFIRNDEGKLQLGPDGDVLVEQATAKRITRVPRVLTKPWHKLSAIERTLNDTPPVA